MLPRIRNAIAIVCSGGILSAIYLQPFLTPEWKRWVMPTVLLLFAIIFGAIPLLNKLVTGKWSARQISAEERGQIVQRARRSTIRALVLSLIVALPAAYAIKHYGFSRNAVWAAAIVAAAALSFAVSRLGFRRRAG